jgi:CheY-like chemotaxis protein
MSDATIARAFDPFFTTKPMGQGTGLGLSMVHGLVSQNEGRISLESELGRGTTFSIQLPEVDQDGGLVRASTPPAGPLVGGAETILVAEDEPAVRQLVTRILERAGYRVLTAANGQEAVALCRERGREVDLMLLDAVMPTLGGREAYEQVIAMRPDIKTIFCSGYSAEALPQSFLDEHRLTLLPKPYAPDTLLNLIREALNG